MMKTLNQIALSTQFKRKNIKLRCVRTTQKMGFAPTLISANLPMALMSFVPPIYSQTKNIAPKSVNHFGRIMYVDMAEGASSHIMRRVSQQTIN